MAREFTVIVERDEDGLLVGSIPALPGCHSQGASIDQLLERMREAIQMCLEDTDEAEVQPVKLVGVHTIVV
jgi:predicted RNase H-like HicB family nuclease